MCCTIFSSLQMSDEPRMNLKLVLTEGVEALLQSENFFLKTHKARCR